MTSRSKPAVAVFQAEWPPALSFIRGLGSAGVDVHAFSTSERAPGRYSRYVSEFDTCPSDQQTDQFVAWLENKVAEDAISLIAPTSDYIAFAAAVVDAEHGSDLLGGTGGPAGPSAVFDCLFKDRFARKIEQLGFPSPEWAAPITVEDAVVAAESIGYPVVLKPRSHIGVGLSRGVIANDENELRASFTPYALDQHQSSALTHDPNVAWPLVQKVVGGDDAQVISVTGCLDRDGQVSALGFSNKLTQWEGDLGIGTMFEVVDEPAFADQAVELVREVLGTGVFEFEVIVDPTTGEYWALEVNPRGFSQMGLDVENGRDLPRLWFGSATGQTLAVRPHRGRKYWRFGLPFYAGLGVAVVLGPGRGSAIRRLLNELRRRSVGSMHTWNDPIPGFVFAAGILRHPRALVRSFLP